MRYSLISLVLLSFGLCAEDDTSITNLVVGVCEQMPAAVIEISAPVPSPPGTATLLSWVAHCQAVLAPPEPEAQEQKL